MASFLMVGVSYSANATSGYAKQVIADGANHYYRLLELGGNTVADSVGNSPGTVVGDVTLGLDGAIAEGGDKAARFSNGSSYITATGADLNFKGALSIEAWLINENESPARYISDGINADRGIGVGITDFNRDEHDYVLFFTSLGVKDYISDVQLPRDGNFHHVVIEGQNAPKDSD